MLSAAPAPKGTPFQFPAGVRVAPSAPRIVDGVVHPQTTLDFERGYHAQGSQRDRGGASALLSGDDNR